MSTGYSGNHTALKRGSPGVSGHRPKSRHHRHHHLLCSRRLTRLFQPPNEIVLPASALTQKLTNQCLVKKNSGVASVSTMRIPQFHKAVLSKLLCLYLAVLDAGVRVLFPKIGRLTRACKASTTGHTWSRWVLKWRIHHGPAQGTETKAGLGRLLSAEKPDS